MEYINDRMYHLDIDSSVVLKIHALNNEIEINRSNFMQLLLLFGEALTGGRGRH